MNIQIWTVWRVKLILEDISPHRNCLSIWTLANESKKSTTETGYTIFVTYPKQKVSIHSFISTFHDLSMDIRRFYPLMKWVFASHQKPFKRRQTQVSEVLRSNSSLTRNIRPFTAQSSTRAPPPPPPPHLEFFPWNPFQRVKHSIHMIQRWFSSLQQMWEVWK